MRLMLHCVTLLFTTKAKKYGKMCISWKSRYKKIKMRILLEKWTHHIVAKKQPLCCTKSYREIFIFEFISGFVFLQPRKKVGLSSNLAPVMEWLPWAYKMSHIWQFDHHWSSHTAVDSGPVQERVTLCNEWQNEIAVSWVHCVHLSSGRFGCIINAGWFFQSLQGCVTLWTKPLPTSVQSLLYNIHTYRGSPPYAHFRTWKKPCYIKFVLVGL